MKAMILAAGIGTRLRPLTLTTPKPLVEVGGKPLIVWHILALKQAGITDIVINTAWLGEKLLAYLQDGTEWGVNIIWSHEHEPLETAGGIKKALPLLGDEPFLLVNGDVWTTYPLARLTQYQMAGHELAHLVLVTNPPQHQQGDFSLTTNTPPHLVYDPKVIFNDKPLVDKQSNLPKTYTFSGISLIHPKLLNAMRGDTGPLAPLLKAAMQNNLVTGEVWEQEWEDVGTLERLNSLNALLKNQLGVL